MKPTIIVVTSEEGQSNFVVALARFQKSLGSAPVFHYERKDGWRPAEFATVKHVSIDLSYFTVELANGEHVTFKTEKFVNDFHISPVKSF